MKKLSIIALVILMTCAFGCQSKQPNKQQIEIETDSLHPAVNEDGDINIDCTLIPLPAKTDMSKFYVLHFEHHEYIVVESKNVGSHSCSVILEHSASCPCYDY